MKDTCFFVFASHVFEFVQSLNRVRESHVLCFDYRVTLDINTLLDRSLLSLH
jgi:hypothetical protein